MKRKIKKAINLVVKKIEKCLRKLYHKVPISHRFKTKAKNVFFSVFGCFLKNTPSYIIWKQTRVKKAVKKKIRYEDFENIKLNKTIAVQLHLFYPDLVEEFVEYLNNIPYKFDLFISVVDEDIIPIIKEKTCKINKVDKIEIKAVENRGRDVAPLIVEFGNKLGKYDYICHIHSKKSLYTGSELTGWRRTLLEGLMGNPKQVVDIFYQFETRPQIGLIYPETWSGLPYWGHNWLSNIKSRNELMEKLGFVDIQYDKYIDFPMGTMFWGRTEAIKDFFKGKIKLSDFAKEEGQVDGTIAHAFERCLGAVNKINGYTVAVYDNEKDAFNYDFGKKNLNQYWNKSIDMLINEAYRYDIVSFDIFDTLVMRNVILPEDLFKVTEVKLKEKEKIEIEFTKYRKKAETNLRKRAKKTDYNIHEIYEELQKITNISSQQCDIIKKTEIQTEIDFIVPRTKMVNALKHIKKNLNKKIILISDMYLTKEIITDILHRNGIDDYDEIYISCECDARKDNGSMWDYIRNKYSGQEILHIGDNETSDAQLPGDRNINIHHIMSSKDIFRLSSVGRHYRNYNMSVVDSVSMGLILNHFFNDPYILNPSSFEFHIKNEYDFGYSIIGPVVSDYMMWTVKNALKDNRDLLFLAREGYLYDNIFTIMKKHMPQIDCYNKLSSSGIKGEYLLVSRRAMTVCNLRNEEDIKDALSIYYEGSLKQLILSRFGINAENKLDDCKVFLPNEADKVFKLIETLCEDILKNAAFERNNYIQYYNRVSSNMGNISVLDIGYAGSIQYYLSKLTGDVFDGYYFATDDKHLALKVPGNSMKGRYIEGDEIQPASPSFIHRYSLVLETVLTSMDNQFTFIDSNMCPHYRQGDDGISKECIKAIHEGAEAFANDLFSLVGYEFINCENNKDVYEELVRMVVEENVLSDELMEKFVLEDNFCSDKKINIFDRLKFKND